MKLYSLISTLSCFLLQQRYIGLEVARGQLLIDGVAQEEDFTKSKPCYVYEERTVQKGEVKNIVGTVNKQLNKKTKTR